MKNTPQKPKALAGLEDFSFAEKPPVVPKGLEGFSFAEKTAVDEEIAVDITDPDNPVYYPLGLKISLDGKGHK